MDFFENRGAEQVISDYIEREMSEYKKMTDQEISEKNIAPEAKVAFNRAPYYNVGTSAFARKPKI